MHQQTADRLYAVTAQLCPLIPPLPPPPPPSPGASGGTVRLTGVDLSPEMLEVAAQKKCYDELQVVNLQAALPFEAASFDLIISAGVFLPGHCGPEILPGLLALLKDHGTAVTTIRKSFYTELEGEFHKHLALSGCKLQGLTLMPYYGAIEAYVMILKKL